MPLRGATNHENLEPTIVFVVIARSRRRRGNLKNEIASLCSQ